MQNYWRGLSIVTVSVLIREEECPEVCVCVCACTRVRAHVYEVEDGSLPTAVSGKDCLQYIRGNRCKDLILFWRICPNGHTNVGFLAVLDVASPNTTLQQFVSTGDRINFSDLKYVSAYNYDRLLVPDHIPATYSRLA